MSTVLKDPARVGQRVVSMKVFFLKLALHALLACCDWLSDYIGTLPSNAISNALKCAPFCQDE